MLKMRIKCGNCGKVTIIESSIKKEYKCECGAIVSIPTHKPVLYAVYMGDWLVGLFKDVDKAVELCNKNNLDPNSHIGEIVSDLC